MKVSVFGLWHLGSVTASCLASRNISVVGCDPQRNVVESLQNGLPPIDEPGLAELIKSGLKSGNLAFESDLAKAIPGAEIIWICFDTPVDEQDRADVDFVFDQIKAALPFMEHNSIILVSSQMPVGSAQKLQEYVDREFGTKKLSVAVSPENLRLGRAIEIFLNPDRVVVGVRDEEQKQSLSKLFHHWTQSIVWMKPASAEMTKHAINSFLAVSVCFANEISTLCELVGADAKEVERGLKSEARIGPGSYLSPGTAFAGGTLARDLGFLAQLSSQNEFPAHLIQSAILSNEHHKSWITRKLVGLLGELDGKTVAIWGLTYKPGTNTLRRSNAIEFARELQRQGMIVKAFDPAVRKLPEELCGIIRLCSDPYGALEGSSALILMTEWPDFLALDGQEIVRELKGGAVVDPKRFLKGLFDKSGVRVNYHAIGVG